MSIDVVVHRGCASPELENSIEGVKELLEFGASITCEIDVAVTKDGVLVLHHDLTLLQTAGVDIPIIETPYQELLRHYPLTRLDDLLNKYPQQKFLLDIRHDSHFGAFGDSDWQPDEDHFTIEKMILPLQHLLSEHSPENLRLTAFSLEFRDQLEKNLPKYDYILAERFTREIFEIFRKSGQLNEKISLPKWILLQCHDLDRRLAESLRDRGHKIITSPSAQGTEYQVDHAIEQNVNGIMVETLDADTLGILRRHNLL